MKRNVFFIMLMLLVWSAARVNAQVGIGSINNPHKGAVLDMSQSESDLGVLFPKVYIFNTKDFTLQKDEGVDAKGMVVYNNNVSLPGGEGLYAWNGSEWKSLSGSANSCVPVTAEVATEKVAPNAKITVTVTDGSPTFSYIWSKAGDPVQTITNVAATSDTYTTTEAGIYTVTVTNPCTATPISFTFTVDNEGGILTTNRNGTFTNEKGQLVYNNMKYNPVESDVPGIYIDDLTKEIVYVGADGIPGNEDDNVFVIPDYPLPTQKTLFSVKYPYSPVNLEQRTYQIGLDFADFNIYTKNDTVRDLTKDDVIVSANSIKKIGVTARRGDGLSAVGNVLTLNYISNCYNSSDITVDATASGVVARFTRGAVMENCYNTGNITTTTGAEAGGLVLANNVGGTATIINSYNAGNIKGLHHVGTIISILSPSDNIKQIITVR